MTNIQAVDLSRAKWVLAAAMATTIIVSNGVQAQPQAQTQTEKPKVAEEGISCEKGSELVIEPGIIEQQRAEEAERLSRKFHHLVTEWRNERGAMSSVTGMSMLPSYQSIIGLGPAALPLILAELRAEGNDPDQWFWALVCISKAADLNGPQISPEDQGNFRRMAQAWIGWGEAQGYAG